jgi:hypothetical protein
VPAALDDQQLDLARRRRGAATRMLDWNNAVQSAADDA